MRLSSILTRFLWCCFCRGNACKPVNRSLLSNGGGSSGTTFNGVARWTPYQHEQGGKGSCGDFNDYSHNSREWAAVSEKFAKEHLGFKGCTTDGSGNQAPQCWMVEKHDGSSLCGTPITVTCDDSFCKNTEPYTVYLVDICPSDRSYHDWADPDSAGDTACATEFVVDLDESIRDEMLTKKDNPRIKISIGADVHTSGGGGSHVDTHPVDSPHGDGTDYSNTGSHSPSSALDTSHDTTHTTGHDTGFGSGHGVQVFWFTPSSGAVGTGFGGSASAGECQWLICWGFYSFKWYKAGIVHGLYLPMRWILVTFSGG